MLAKRKHPDDTDKTAKKPKKDTRGGSGSGGAGKREDVEGADDGEGEGEGSLPTEDDVSAPQTEDDNQAQLAVPDAADVHDDEAQLVVFEALDKALTCEYCLSHLTDSRASLSACSYLTVDDVEAGRYPGFSKIKRLELDYRREHPQVVTRRVPTFISNDPKQRDWVAKLPAIEFAMNTARSESTGYAPFFLNNGQMPRSLLWNSDKNRDYPGVAKFALQRRLAILAAHDSMIAARVKQTRAANRKRQTSPFAAGDLIYL
ncbi:hypothetical protein B0H10DRAFT_1777776, partial [Mycena sp. CBHHK59/15]